MPENVTTVVQSGENLRLYAQIYNCKVEDLEKLNKGKIGKDGKIKEGEVLIIPIGKKPAETNKSERTKVQTKANWFNDKLEEAKLKIYDHTLTNAEREKYENEYIKLLNQKKARDEVADFSVNKDNMHFDLTIKKDITITEFRKLFPEIGKNFRDYSDRTEQTRYKNGVGYVRDPDYIVLHKGAHFSLKTQEVAHQGILNELWTSVQKTLGLGEFD